MEFRRVLFRLASGPGRQRGLSIPRSGGTPKKITRFGWGGGIGVPVQRVRTRPRPEGGGGGGGLMEVLVNIWNIIGLLFWSFAFVAYLFALFAIFADLFRDQQLGGGWKALWVIFLIFVPFLTALVYLIARGRGMAERSAKDVAQSQQAADSY